MITMIPEFWNKSLLLQCTWRKYFTYFQINLFLTPGVVQSFQHFSNINNLKNHYAQNYSIVSKILKLIHITTETWKFPRSNLKMYLRYNMSLKTEETHNFDAYESRNIWVYALTNANLCMKFHISQDFKNSWR